MSALGVLLREPSRGGTTAGETRAWFYRGARLWLHKSGARRLVDANGWPEDAEGMFVIELTYKAPLADIDAHMTEHVAFLNKYYASGKFLISGRKVPRDGGIIIATGEDRSAIEALIREDPFYTEGLADFRILQFRASQRAREIPKRFE